MTKANLTEIVAVLDRSGSMQDIRRDMEGAFDAFIAGQREVPGECVVTLVQFDDVVETVFEARPIREVGGLNLVPRNYTCLYDAIGRTVNAVGARLTRTPEHERPAKVVFIIVTDGHENASQEFSAVDVHRMITRQRDDYQWQFVFMGADQDAYAAAAMLGIAAGAVVSNKSTGASARASYAAVGSVLRSYRTNESAEVKDVGAVYLNCLQEEEQKAGGASGQSGV